METVATYLIKSSVWLTGFALIYALFLRNERFFSLNRIFLVSGILASIVFPLFTWHYTVIFPVVPTNEVFEQPILQRSEIPIEEPFPVQNILLLIYLFGSLYLVFRLIKQTVSVWKIIRRSEPLHFNSAKLIHTDQYPASFSFFSFVFVNPSIDETETSEIVNHEQEHIRQRHWIDLLLFEILCTIQWFNPAIWLYGRFIRQNHEYLADEAALQRTSNPAVYRAALLNQMFGGPVISLANSFNYSINKKRFTMMKHTIQSPFRKLKLLLILPLIAGVFYAFAAPEYQFVQADNNQIIQDEKTVTGKVVDDKGEALPGASVVVSGKPIGTQTDINGNFKLELIDDSPIVISFVGFDSQKVNPDFEKEMMVTMKINTIHINLDHPNSEIKIPLRRETNPLIVLDGVISENQNADNIPPETIESITILKNQAAIDKYGEKGKNGVIEITMKKVDDFPPMFPGGELEMRKWIATHINYPQSALKNRIQGQVLVTFWVSKNGNIKDIKISKGVEESLDNEAIRVIKSMPNWSPGKVNGQIMDMQLERDVNFILQNPNAIDKTILSTSDHVDKSYTIVEEMPQFPGGIEALKKYVASTLQYPAIALENGIIGQIYVNFVVAKDGSVTDAKIARGVDPSLDKEALRIVNNMPKWKPGSQAGKNVRVSYSMPINFNLPEDYHPKSKEKLKKNDAKIIGNISWMNNTVYTSADLNKVFGMKKGDNYTKEQLQSIINGPVSSLYLDKGYVFSKIDISEIPTSNGVVNLTFTIYEGIRGKIGRIDVKGNKKVSTEDILQKIKIKPGDLFSKTKIVQSIEAINKMDKFNPEEIRPEIIPDSNNSNQEFGTVNIIFNVTEK